MNDPMSLLLPGIPHASTVGLALLAIPVFSLVFVAGRVAWLLACELARESGRRARLSAEARERIRYAEELSVAAQRAAANAERYRELWRSALANVADANRALDETQERVRRLSAAAALPAPRTPRTPAEYAEREKYLHRAAMAACARRELSIYQLSDALAHRNGWDPRLHPTNQEIVLSRAIRDHLSVRCAEAIRREYAAWQAAQTAAVAAQRLREEATMAAWRAQLVRAWLRPGPGDVPEPAIDITQVIALPRAVPRWRPAHVG